MACEHYGCDSAFSSSAVSSRAVSSRPVTASGSPFLVITEHHGRRTVLRLEGELDVCSTDYLRQAIGNALNRAPETLVADLSALGFADCAGLSVLVWAHDILAGQGHELIVTGCQPIVRRLLTLTGLNVYLHVSNEPQPG